MGAGQRSPPRRRSDTPALPEETHHEPPSPSTGASGDRRRSHLSSDAPHREHTRRAERCTRLSCALRRLAALTAVSSPWPAGRRWGGARRRNTVGVSAPRWWPGVARHRCTGSLTTVSAETGLSRDGCPRRSARGRRRGRVGSTTRDVVAAGKREVVAAQRAEPLGAAHWPAPACVTSLHLLNLHPWVFHRRPG
jgi:hypothetical protein